MFNLNVSSHGHVYFVLLSMYLAMAMFILFYFILFLFYFILFYFIFIFILFYFILFSALLPKLHILDFSQALQAQIPFLLGPQAKVSWAQTSLKPKFLKPKYQSSLGGLNFEGRPALTLKADRP